MIDTIRVVALKSIKDLTVKCSKLNLFVGTNSSGKSTFLQALLLLTQQELNGKYISIGDFREVRNYYMPNDSIRIEIIEKNKTKPAWIEFIEDKEKEAYNIRTSMDETFVFEIMEMDECIDPEQTDFLVDEFGFHYLSCHRIGVNDIYAKNMLNESDFGIDGEYALAYLLKNESEVVPDELVVKDIDVTNSLLEQVNYWLNYIVGTTLLINDIKKTNYLQVKYNNNPANASSEALYCRPINVGSGISYLISIIISCLGAESDSIIIIENPEIHLHPKAQSKLCDFIYFVSKAGRQLFVETHSDHIFNGLRVGVATGKISQEDISVNFFAMNERCETQCNPILFKEYGKIVGTNDRMDINDLFDQFEIDLNRMLGL
jgi:predicted ATPase